jgi:CRP/FNR family transcriptional regulator
MAGMNEKISGISLRVEHPDDCPNHGKQAPINAKQVKVACSNCNLRELCMPMGLSHEEMTKLDELVFSRKRVPRGQSLYRTGDPFGALYAVRTGVFKTTVSSEEGRDHVTGFQMAGEIMGLDGMATDRYSCDAIALEDAEVCIMPFGKIEDLSREIKALQTHLHRIMSREIVRDQNIMLLLGTMRAEERLAAFLVNLGQRLQARGFSSTDMVLRMTREEIGSYLGLKLETVSRTFSKFVEDGLITVKQKVIHIIEPERLAQLAKPRE